MHVSLSTLTANGGSGAAAIATYYTRGINARAIEIGIDELSRMAGYYAGEHPSHGGPVARWYGGSVASLGLVAGAPFDPKHLRRVLQQLDPNTGAKLQNNGGRRASISAMDITFSAEKQLSTLWLLGDAATRIQIEHIMDEASREAIGYLQTHAAMVRRGNGGMVSRSSSGYLALETDHSTARPVRGQVAPHLHRHYLHSEHRRA